MSPRATDRDDIIAKASLLFWEHGYDRTSVKDITRACNCEPANLYNYFRSKEQLLFEVLSQETARMFAAVEHLESDEDTSPGDQLKLFLRSHLSQVLVAPSSSMLYDSELRNLSPESRKAYVAVRDQYEGVLRKIIRRGIEAGVFAPLDEKLAAYSILAILVRTRLWYSPGGRLNEGEVVEFTFKFVAGALGYTRFQNDPASEAPPLDRQTSDPGGDRAAGDNRETRPAAIVARQASPE